MVYSSLGDADKWRLVQTLLTAALFAVGAFGVVAFISLQFSSYGDFGDMIEMGRGLVIAAGVGIVLVAIGLSAKQSRSDASTPARTIRATYTVIRLFLLVTSHDSRMRPFEITGTRSYKALVGQMWTGIAISTSPC